jgi:anti-anti-sigma factor
MTDRVRTAAVKQLPETVTSKEMRLFLNDLKSCLDGDRPCIVLDCSKVRKMDSAAIHLLLCCLEEAMKRNGDAKLAAVPPAAEAVLERVGVHRLFETFDTVAEAAGSFRRLRASSISHAYAGSHQAAESAA